MKQFIRRVFFDGIYLFGLWIIGWVNPIGRAELMEKWIMGIRKYSTKP